MGDQTQSTCVWHITYLFALASSHNGVKGEQASSRTEDGINILRKDLIKCSEQPTVICSSELSGMEGKLPTSGSLADDKRLADSEKSWSAYPGANERKSPR